MCSFARIVASKQPTIYIRNRKGFPKTSSQLIYLNYCQIILYKVTGFWVSLTRRQTTKDLRGSRAIYSNGACNVTYVYN